MTLRHYIGWNKPDIKDDTLHESIYMKSKHRQNEHVGMGISSCLWSGGNTLERGRRELSVVMEIFFILIGMLVTWVVGQNS